MPTTGNEPALPQDKSQVPMLGGPGALTHIALSLDDEDPQVRAKATEALAAIGTDDAVDMLRPLLTEENTFVQARALQAIGRVGTTYAIDTLIDYINNAGNAYRIAEAVIAMGVPLESDALAERVVRYLDRFVGLNTHDWLPQQALRAVGRLANHHPGSILPMIRPLIDEYLGVTARQGWRYSSLIEELDPAHYLDELTTLALDENADPEARRRALLMLKNTRAKQATNVFLSLIDHKDGNLAHTAHQGLKRVRKREDIPDIVELLTHPDWQVRRRAIRICQSRRLRSTIPHLRPLLDDSRGPVRLAAAEALLKVGAEGIRETLLTMMEEDRSQRVRDGLASLTYRIRSQ